MMLTYSFLFCLLSGIVATIFGCDVIIVKDGTVTSPNYPNNYGTRRKCNIKIYAPPGKLVQIKILDVDLPGRDGGYCGDDYINVYDGGERYDDVLAGPLCGKDSVGSTFKTSQTKGLIYFKSGRTGTTNKGFKFEVKIINAPLTVTTPDPTASTTTGPTTTRRPGDHVWFTGQCGTSKYSDAGEFALSARIIGGRQARTNEFPWQVALILPTGELRCGGSIVNQKWVVTAAHCVYPNNKFYKVVAGAHDGSKSSETSRQIYDIDDLWIHSHYNSKTYHNDIALLKISGSIAMNDNVRPVCPPRSLSNHLYKKAVVSGWGKSRDDDDNLFNPTILQYTTVNITSRSYCQSAFNRLNGTNRLIITENMICGSDNKGETKRDTCQGDSGGPLTIKKSNGKFVLAGITSWGVGCAKGTPGVYTQVSKMMNWMQNVMDRNT